MRFSPAVVHGLIPVLSVLGSLSLLAPMAQAQGTATFDDFVGAVVDQGTDLNGLNGGSSVYQGVTWDSQIEVVGDQYKVDTTTPGPNFAVPHSGHFAITNGGLGADGLLLTTNLVLTGAWFGQNEYYGFGGGADQVTVSALNGATVLDSVTMNLPDNNTGQPEPLQFLDTSQFQSLSGITGYRIDRNAPSQFATNWVGDDFTFVSAVTVPEPTTGTLLLGGVGLAGLLALRRRRAALVPG